MEELHDAIEDAQYIQAMLDSTPHPTKKWKELSIDDLTRFKMETLSHNSNALDADIICANSLGFYLVSYIIDTKMLTVSFSVFYSFQNLHGTKVLVQWYRSYST